MSENYNSLGKVNDLKSCKEEIKRLNCKLNECEAKIKLFEKQQQKIKTLEKVNSQNSIRLIQCISNVRDLLHSNKLLRQQLNAQKQMRIQAEATVKLLKQQLKFSMTQYQLPMAQIMESSAEQHGTITPKHRNIHKLSKIQKFSKLKLSTKRYSTQIFDLQVESPKKENSKLLIGLSKNFYINQLYNGSEMKKAQKNKKKFSTSLDLRKEQQKYIKAQTRRKRSIQRSLQKQEILQYKPQKQDSALTQNNF